MELLYLEGDIYNINKKKSNLIRDKFEYRLVSYFKKNKPILMVCRGFQLMAVKLKIK